MKALKKFSAPALACLICCLSLTAVSASEVTADYLDSKISALLEYEYKYTKTCSLDGFVSDYLAKNAGTSTADWFVISLDRYGASFDRSLCKSKLNGVLADIYNSGYENAKITDLQRIALAYTACSADIRSINGVNLLGDCSYNREISELSSRGITTLDYALIVLDSKNYYVPKSSASSREKIVSEILSLQLEDGGFAITGTAADPDVTAMTITALAPYVENSQAVSKAVDRALSKLSSMQKSDGGFSSYGKINCESSAQVVVALTSLGIDPSTDERFIKNGCSPLDAMLSFQLSSGGFSHLQGGNENRIANYQALYAMVAYKNYLKSGRGLYIFSQEENPRQVISEPAASKASSSNSCDNSESDNAEVSENPQKQSAEASDYRTSENSANTEESKSTAPSEKKDKEQTYDTVTSPAETTASADEATLFAESGNVDFEKENSEHMPNTEDAVGTAVSGAVITVSFALLFIRPFKKGGNKK